MFLFFLIHRPLIPTRTDTLFPYTTLFRSTRIEADIVSAGIGLVPNIEIADAAGLTVANGIVVDLHMQTSDPDIYALGDCAQAENAFYGRSMRLASVPNAIEQARVAAAAIIGKPIPRSDERRVGNECVSTCKSRWSPYY